MKRFFVLLLALLLCASLCSCDSLLRKAKELVTGVEESVPPEDFVSSRENEEYSFDEFVDYIRLTGYLGENISVSIPSEIDGKPVKIIGSLTFFETKVESVTIPDSVTVVEESAFYYADRLVSIRLPSNITSLGSRAFAWCNSLETVYLSTSLKEIPDYCFNHCIALKNVIIPPSITRIGTRAFSYCDSLDDQTLPSNVLTVGDLAFSYCSELQFISIANNELSFGRDVFDFSENVTLIADEGSSSVNYCEEYGLRWSTSKSVPSVVPVPEGGGSDASGDSSVSAEETSSDED